MTGNPPLKMGAGGILRAVAHPGFQIPYPPLLKGGLSEVPHRPPRTGQT